MTLLPSGAKIHMALGVTDMRKGLDGLAMLVQGTLRHDPFSGHLFVFRGRKADLLKIVFWDGTGLCLFTKRLEQSRFFWPAARYHCGNDLLRWIRRARKRRSTTVSQALTLQYDKVLFLLEPSPFAQAAIGKRVTIIDYPDSRLAIRYKDQDLPYRTFDKISTVKQAAVVENKRLRTLLDMIKLYQDHQPQEKRSRGDVSRRRNQARHVFSVG